MKRQKLTDMPIPKLLKKLEEEVNAFVRERDKNLPCISCGKYRESYNAGHYYSVGGHPNVRFNLDNIHKQCVYCNLHLSGNIRPYRENLLLKIGEDRLNLLDSIAKIPVKFYRHELIELINEYRDRKRQK